MKKVCWIDDDPTFMLHVAQGVFPYLWDKEILPITIFFGDAFKKDRSQMNLLPSDVARYADSILGLFMKYCAASDKWDTQGKTYEQKKAICPQKGHVKLLSLGDERISELAENWKNDNISTRWCSELPDELKVDFLLKEMDIDPNICVALDLALLFDDLKRLAASTPPLPIISMELYNVLENEGHSCFLFSHHSYNDTFKTNWMKIYSEKHDNKDYVIYNRNNLKEKNFNKGIVEKLINMITKEQ